MSIEYVIPDSVVISLEISLAVDPGTTTADDEHFIHLANILRSACAPPRAKTFFFNGRGLRAEYASSDGLARGCYWAGADEGEGAGEIVFSFDDQEDVRIRVAVKLAVSKDRRTAWLTIEFNPTTMQLGVNIHPAAFIDATTGNEIAYPSSDWTAMQRTFRLGFEFLEQLARAVANAELFDEATKLAIDRGDFHLVRVQWAAAKRVKQVPRFLQLLTVVYDQTIARNWGIIKNATHLGLEFQPFVDPENHRLTGVLFQKRHSNKLVFSVSAYDKLARWIQMHRNAGDLSEAQQVTVKESVRLDITAHSEGILIIIKKAQKTLESLGAEGLTFFDFLSPDVFLTEEPKPTLWWLQRAIFILSHFRQRGKLERFSFGVWLVPYIETKVLHFDVVAKISAKGFHRMLALSDPVAVAWRSDKMPNEEGWADRLAKAAKCSPTTVRNRRDLWWAEIEIDISLSFQFYADVLHFGQSSMTSPENITRMLTAAQGEDGEALVRLYSEALANFEEDRVTILNPALARRPRALPLEGPEGSSSEVGVPDNESGEEGSDDGELDLLSLDAEGADDLDAEEYGLDEEGRIDQDSDEENGQDEVVEEDVEDLSHSEPQVKGVAGGLRHRAGGVPTLFRALPPSGTAKEFSGSASKRAKLTSVSRPAKPARSKSDS